jgi:hypothetical protein
MSSSREAQTALNSRLERRTPQTTKCKSGKNGNVHHSSQHCPPPLQARIHPPAGRHRTHRHTSWQSTRHACLARQAGDTITLDASCFFETRATGTPSPCPCHPHVRSDSPCPASAPLSRRRYDGTQWHKSSERDPIPHPFPTSVPTWILHQHAAHLARRGSPRRIQSEGPGGEDSPRSPVIEGETRRFAR